MEKKIPLRQCIACREQKPKKEMTRIVKTPEGEIKLDRTGKLNGRGAYICDNEECIKKLRKGRLLNRTFSQEVDLSVYDGIENDYAKSKK